MSQVTRGVLIATLATMMAVPQVQAGILAPTRPSQLVTALTSAAAPACSVGKQVDRMYGASGFFVPFVIPAGQVFVVTSYEFNHNENLPDGTQVFAQLVIDGGTKGLAFVSHISAIMHGLNAFASLQVPPGIVVNASDKLCLDSSNTLSQSGVTVHGFLARDN